MMDPTIAQVASQLGLTVLQVLALMSNPQFPAPSSGSGMTATWSSAPIAAFTALFAGERANAVGSVPANGGNSFAEFFACFKNLRFCTRQTKLEYQSVMKITAKAGTSWEKIVTLAHAEFGDAQALRPRPSRFGAWRRHRLRERRNADRCACRGLQRELLKSAPFGAPYAQAFHPRPSCFGPRRRRRFHERRNAETRHGLLWRRELLKPSPLWSPLMRKLIALALLALAISGGAIAMYDIERPTAAHACVQC